MVAGFQEEIDSQDEMDEVFSQPPKPAVDPSSKKVTSYDIELSTDEDDSPVVAKDEDLSDDDNLWKTKNQVSKKTDSPFIVGGIFGSNAPPRQPSETLIEKAPSTDSSSDSELPPGVLEVSKFNKFKACFKYP